MSDITQRRFGSRHDKPCVKPETLTCAKWECQERDRCIFDEGGGAMSEGGNIITIQLSEVEYLRAENDRLRNAEDAIAPYINELKAENDRLREELEHHKQIATDLRSDIDRLREALTSARTMLVAFGGDPRGSANGDEIQAAILDLIDAALAAEPRQ